MLLFDEIHRDYQEPAHHSEESFTFLNRSARPAAERVRRLLEKWFTEYPLSEQAKLRSRFRSEFQAAFFELLLHAFFKSLLCSVAIHPRAGSNRRTRPDFLVRFPRGTECFIEARVVTDVPEEEVSRQNRLNRLYDQIDNLHSPDFFLGLKDLEEETDLQPSGSRFRESVRQWLNTLDPDETILTVSRYGEDSLPSLLYEENSFRVTVFAIPKKAEARGKPGTRPLGIFPGNWRWGGTSPALKRGLSKKAGKYGGIEKPYLIAVNCISPWGMDTSDILEALFGTDNPDNLPHQDVPNPRANSDGLWYGPSGIKNTTVSGIIIGAIFPWNLATVNFVLYHNPFAKYPCPQVSWQISEAFAKNGKLKWSKGERIGDLFGLPQEWPGQLFNGR